MDNRSRYSSSTDYPTTDRSAFVPQNTHTAPSQSNTFSYTVDTEPSSNYHGSGSSSRHSRDDRRGDHYDRHRDSRSRHDPRRDERSSRDDRRYRRSKSPRRHDESSYRHGEDRYGSDRQQRRDDRHRNDDPRRSERHDVRDMRRPHEPSSQRPYDRRDDYRAPAQFDRARKPFRRDMNFDLDNLEGVMPLDEWPRKVKLWDVPPVGFEGMPVDAVKNTGLFIPASKAPKVTNLTPYVDPNRMTNLIAQNELVPKNKVIFVGDQEISTVVSDSPDKIFIGNIPESLIDSQIVEIFLAFGPLKAFFLVKDGLGNSRGFAFCEYEDASITDAACSGLNNFEILDRTLVVQRASEAKLPDQQSLEMSEGLDKMDPIDEGEQHTYTPVIQLINMVKAEDLITEYEFHDVVDDITEGIAIIAAPEQILVPRPITHPTLPNSAFGKVYIKFDSPSTAYDVIHALVGKTFQERLVLGAFFPEEKFLSGELY